MIVAMDSYSLAKYAKEYWLLKSKVIAVITRVECLIFFIFISLFLVRSCDINNQKQTVKLVRIQVFASIKNGFRGRGT